AGLDAVIRSKIEMHTLLALDGKNNHAAVLPDARTFNGRSGKSGPGTDVDLSDLKVHAYVRGCRVEETHNVRAQERLRDALPRKQVRRHYRVSPGGEQVFLGIVFAGAGNDLEPRIQSARSQDNVKVSCIGGRRCNQSAGALDLRLAESVFLSRVADDDQPILGGVELGFGLALFNDDERHRPAGQLAGSAASDASGAADDVVIGEPADFALHSPPAEESLQLEF